MGELADKKMLLQSRGVKLDWKLQEGLSTNYTGAVSDYLSFFLDEIPVGILNGFYSDRSPFEIRAHKDGYAIFENDEHYHDVRFLSKPGFLDERTGKGTKMAKLCKMVAPGFPIIYMHRGCVYWGKDQCKFCVVGYIDTETVKDCCDVAETVKAGVREKAIKTHVALTAGALPDDEAFILMGDALSAIRSMVDIPVSINLEPPRELKSLEHLLSADTVYFNLEVYDQKRRKEILPGKSEFKIDYYDRVFLRCLEDFEENQVASVLLAGLEDDETFLEGVEHLASLGVLPVPVPFYPSYHSKLESTQPPPANRMNDLYIETIEILSEYGLDPFKTKAGFMRGGAIFALKEIIKDL